eukprot:scaffold22268_cov123-Isochrysis_galbana.AAC.2
MLRMRRRGEWAPGAQLLGALSYRAVKSTSACGGQAPAAAARLVLRLRVVEVELLGADHGHHDVEDAELAGGEGADHDAAREQTLRAQLHDARLGGDVAQARHHGSSASGARLVDFGEERVGWVRDDGGHDTGHDARREGDAHVAALGHGLGVGAQHAVDLLGRRALHRKLGHCVRDLLEQDGDEARVEGADETVLPHELGGAGGHARCVVRVGDQPDAARLVRAQEDIGDELGHRRRGKVDFLAVVPGRLVADRLGDVDLEVLDATELEPALQMRGAGAQVRLRRGHARCGWDGGGMAGRRS